MNNKTPEQKQKHSDELEERTNVAVERAVNAGSHLEDTLQALAARAHKQLRKPRRRLT